MIIDDEFFKLIKRTFTTEKERPDNLNYVMKIHVSMLKNIICPDIVNTTKKQISGTRNLKFSLNLQ